MVGLYAALDQALTLGRVEAGGQRGVGAAAALGVVGVVGARRHVARGLAGLVRLEGPCTR